MISQLGSCILIPAGSAICVIPCSSQAGWTGAECNEDLYTKLMLQLSPSVGMDLPVPLPSSTVITDLFLDIASLQRLHMPEAAQRLPGLGGIPWHLLASGEHRLICSLTTFLSQPWSETVVLCQCAEGEKSSQINTELC